MRRRVIVGVLSLLSTVVLQGPTVSADPGSGSGSGSGCGHGLQKAADDPETGPVCSHGADPATDANGAEVFAADTGPAPAAPCFGDGESGHRIEVIYGYPSDTPDNYAASVPAIRSAVAFADSYFESSDAGTAQHLRWVCDASRQVAVQKVALAPIGSDRDFTFDDMYGSVAGGPGKGKRSTGFRRSDRIYVTFVDNIYGSAYSKCGEGQRDADDSPGLNNRNNTGPAYSLIACWQGTTTLHEVGHNLGAVQNSAPHSSQQGHCFDEFDLMCYDDDGPYFRGPDGTAGTADDRSTQVVCVDPLRLLPYDGDRQFDCNQDDYYDPSPAAESYLATKWNVANSNWVVK